eukprot:CAMPEP_0173255598 /NCGR_PEP_ID=MMETSP1142-20121109/22634_1 /TAXON_ID=483371 /ORGANISM="non described non described, Strain CCMP2298" /LENGTH=37 /DNA_ID= /DNA_START= /DNA_END= /DNA_ORIENTATION=
MALALGVLGTPGKTGTPGKVGIPGTKIGASGSALTPA